MENSKALAMSFELADLKLTDFVVLLQIAGQPKRLQSNYVGEQ